MYLALFPLIERSSNVGLQYRRGWVGRGTQPHTPSLHGLHPPALTQKITTAAYQMYVFTFFDSRRENGQTKPLIDSRENEDE